MAAPDSVPAPRPWGLRSGGRAPALHRLPAAGPVAASDRVDYRGGLSVAQMHAGCGLEEERAKALPAELLAGGPPPEFWPGMEQIGREETHDEAHFVCGEAVVGDIALPHLPAPTLVLSYSRPQRSRWPVDRPRRR